MSNFVMMTDSAADISRETLTQWGVQMIEMSFHFENTAFSAQGSVKDFYDCMRNGGVAKTAAVNPDTFCTAFREELEKGNDILYLAFSSGLSTTCNSARIAAEELAAEFPERKIIVVDSLCASAGEGLFVYLVVQKKNEGCGMEELAAYAEDLKLHICHWFTVDDLVYLKRGGRVSPAVAFVGGVLGIKPILHVDDEGHLINVSKTRGRKSSIAALEKKYEELALDKSGGTVFISHGDCIDDANALAAMLKERCGVAVHTIADIGPVIGAHSGPGTLRCSLWGRIVDFRGNYGSVYCLFGYRLRYRAGCIGKTGDQADPYVGDF